MKINFYKNIENLKYTKLKNKIKKEVELIGKDLGQSLAEEIFYLPEYDLLFSLDYLWQQGSRFLNSYDIPTIKYLYRKLFKYENVIVYRGLSIASNTKLSHRRLLELIYSENREFISCTTNLEVAKKFSTNSNKYIVSKKYMYCILLEVSSNKCHRIIENDMGEDEIVITGDYKINILNIEEKINNKEDL